MKLANKKLVVGLVVAVLAAGLSLLMPGRSFAGKTSFQFVDAKGNTSQINGGDNGRFIFIDPFTIKDTGTGQTYQTASTSCDGDNIYVCASGDVFHPSSYWYWPGGNVGATANNQCVSALVLAIRQTPGGTGLNAADLFVVNAHPRTSASSTLSCGVKDTSGNYIPDQDITGLGALARSDSNVGGPVKTVVNPGDVVSLQQGNGSDKGMFHALATEFTWINPNQMQSVMTKNQKTLNKVASQSTLQSLAHDLAQGTTAQYSHGYDYYLPSGCINGKGQVMAVVAVNPSDVTTATLLHRLNGDGDQNFVANWYGDQQSCLYGENHWNSPNRIWTGGKGDSTIGMADVGNYANPGSEGGEGGGNTGGGGNGGSNDSTLDCGGGNSTLNWIICPFVNLAQGAAIKLDGFISNLLTEDIGQTFNDNYHAAWSDFRIIATAIIVIAGLVMITSEALGFEILDAYTIRKTLPRLLIALIGISLSWPLMEFVVRFFNTFGQDVYGLIIAPFKDVHAQINPGVGILSTILVPAAGVGALFIFGPAALLIIVSGLLGLLMAFLILILRQIAIVAAIILAPIAIACFILPNTQKVWKIWHENFIGLLMMFPLVMAFIAAGHAFAVVAISHGSALDSTVSQIIGLIAYFIPYFLLPMAFRMATGAIGSIAGMVNDRSKGVFDRMKNARHKAAEERIGALKQGFNRTKIGSHLQEGHQRSLARREAWGSGAIGIGRHGTARYETALRNTKFGHLSQAAAEAIKNNPSAAANDDANKVARIATSQDDFIARYVASRTDANSTADQRRKARDEAMNQLIYTEQAFGAAMGSEQMKHTAATATFSSSSAQDDVIELQQAMHKAVSDGLMTSSQAAALVKSSGSLASSAGFADLVNAAEGKTTGAHLLEASARGFNAGNSHRMRKKQAEQLAEHMAAQAGMAAAGPGGTSSVEFATAIADAAGIHDVINGMTPDVREAFATRLNGATVANKRIREHEAEMEGGKTGIPNEAYLDRRKTWSSAAIAGGGATPGGMPPGSAGGPSGPASPGGTGAPGSDIRLKRNIITLHQTPEGIQLYRFRYLWSEQEYIGVMAQDLVDTHPEALSKDDLGYYRVDYSKLGLRMMTIEEWEATKAPVQSVS